jgi:MFS transporter, putative metabolite:H+ symporter
MARSDGSPGLLIARLDRIPVWSLPGLFVGIIGVGILFTFYDIFDINVSFIQTCTQIVPHCSPPSAANYIGLPVLLNLVGYVIGTLILGPLADRAGRRDLLLVTMVITGLGSVLTAVVDNYTWFIIARTVTGIGIGADLAIVNTYINEMAPREGRARYTALIFFFSALGAVLGIWLGLWLTTPATPLPLGLPFAVAGPKFAYGWRIMYLIGGALAFVGVLLRFQLPESARWLITRGRLADAAQVIEAMERRASTRTALGPVEQPAFLRSETSRVPYSEVLGDPMYLGRVFVLFAMWFVAYITLYAFGAGLTTILASLHYPPPEAGLIAGVGTFGFVLAAVVAFAYGEFMERKAWLPVAALLTVIGGIIIALAGPRIDISIIGSIVLFFGFNLWVPVAYSWTTENFPTRARTTGFALVDGIGHVGGGIGVALIAPLIPHLNPLEAMLLICSFLVLAAVIAQFGTATRSRMLEEVSP